MLRSSIRKMIKGSFTEVCELILYQLYNRSKELQNFSEKEKADFMAVLDHPSHHKVDKDN